MYLVIWLAKVDGRKQVEVFRHRANALSFIDSVRNGPDDKYLLLRGDPTEAIQVLTEIMAEAHGKTHEN
jgi:hypothetical protein